jgi:ribulose-bisphosphate carboxylase large chain
MNLFKEILDSSSNKYLIATYEIVSQTTLKDAAWNIAVGQSVGNPNVRNEWETEELFENHSCVIFGDESSLNKSSKGDVCIGFPVINTNWDSDGIAHLLCQLMGGHVDIDIIQRCRLKKIEFPDSVKSKFLGPKFGMSGIRSMTGRYGMPLLGSILKPKTGLSPEKILEMVKKMVDGGVDFIKEDEILSNPDFCPLERRVDIIANYLVKQNSKVVFCHTINCDPLHLKDRVEMVASLGGNGVHINIWSGLGSYNSIRKLDLPLFIHFQKSGDRVLTNKKNPFSISWPVICQLATLVGVDSIQVGMLGGYSSDDEMELHEAINILRDGNTLPILSCGFHPGLVAWVTDKIGVDYLANSGGAVHGHPSGTKAGAAAMRQAIDRNLKEEYEVAVAKWGELK